MNILLILTNLFSYYILIEYRYLNLIFKTAWREVPLIRRYLSFTGAMVHLNPRLNTKRIN
jgi:hypothetical protein